MNKIILIACLAISINAIAQVPHWQWAKSAGGKKYDMATSVAVDASGNTYLAGYFTSSTLVFGSITLTNAGSEDIFLAKYDANGNALWAKSAGGRKIDIANSVAVDALGNAYLAGYFTSPTLVFGFTTLINTGSEDIFLIKYDANGNVLWAKRAGGKDNDRVNSVAVDASGTTRMVGYFLSSTLTFGSAVLTNSNFLWSTNYSCDIFLAQYDANGNVLWAKSAGGKHADIANSVAVDVSGNSYVAGYFYNSTLTFGSTTLTNAVIEAIFFTKYDANGNVLWAKSAECTGEVYTTSIAVDAAGNTYLAGYFNGSTLIFGSITLKNVGLGSVGINGTDNLFLAKFDATGNVLWAKSSGGGKEDRAVSVAVDALGNSYLAGNFQSYHITFGSTILTKGGSLGSNDIFLTKYDATGNVLWVKTAMGRKGDNTTSVAVDISGNCYVAGYFNSPTLTFDATILKNKGKNKIFIVKLVR